MVFRQSINNGARNTNIVARSAGCRSLEGRQDPDTVVVMDRSVLSSGCEVGGVMIGFLDSVPKDSFHPNSISSKVIP